MSAAAGASAASAAAIAQAIRACGVFIHVESRDFLNLVSRGERALVVRAIGGFFSTNYQYLTSYKGLAFFTKSPFPLQLPADCEVVQAKRIWMPG